ncbi:DsbA family protein [Streptomyces sp. JV176]|uniref:DsbA family protein n=1 Tax=Streptomyces sp. JV176 TaxID=858630 RepID=UPI002E79738C|nr:DsbA family protein [Streptomyces sp. JV176]MEE1801114.1 DsbA family protein [Streptomyces sp. JV176]
MKKHLHIAVVMVAAFAAALGSFPLPSPESSPDEPRGSVDAEQLGPDLGKFDAALKDPATTARVRVDQRDGLGLGVQGTPAFFLDGERVAPASTEEFEALIKDRLSRP